MAETDILPACIGQFDTGLSVEYFGCDIDLIALFGILGSTALGVACLIRGLHLPFECQHLAGAVEYAQCLISVAVIGQNCMSGFALEKHSHARAIERRMCVELFMFQIVMFALLVLLLIFTVLTEGTGTSS